MLNIAADTLVRNKPQMSALVCLVELIRTFIFFFLSHDFQ